MASSNSLLFSLAALLLLVSFIQTSDAKLNGTLFMEQILSGHNAARAEVGVPPLNWDRNLAVFARGYIDEDRRADCKLLYSERWSFGETIYTGPRTITAVDAVAYWVSGKQWYTYATNSCQEGKDCSDYTQVVWRTTINVGCAQIKCDTGDLFIACEYYPHGNYAGARPY
ncbi:hypothetical protein MKW94_019401 [Papaver nudicaule]|uniref:SCP domain-containing protein n=1 Tax=Papaver nudicaule TaxID=74823 RepID=A0AA41S325_PAPNU|nr:hypothetical protein [Papaver nudicaule]